MMAQECRTGLLTSVLLMPLWTQGDLMICIIISISLYPLKASVYYFTSKYRI